MWFGRKFSVYFSVIFINNLLSELTLPYRLDWSLVFQGIKVFENIYTCYCHLKYLLKRVKLKWSLLTKYCTDKMYVITDKLNYCVNCTPLTSKPDQILNNKNKQQKQRPNENKRSAVRWRVIKICVLNLFIFFVFYVLLSRWHDDQYEPTRNIVYCIGTLQ